MPGGKRAIWWLICACVLGTGIASAGCGGSTDDRPARWSYISPAGTGLISSWGRDEAGDTLSLGGDGAFLHGLWTPPSWLALGADVRLAAIRNDVGGPESPEVAAFPMQADLYARAAYDAFSFN